MRELDIAALPASLDSDLNIIEKPSFPLRGMYAHQHWDYAHPYALRTWTIDEWKSYVDILALMRVNLFQIWSMAAILPTPFSPEDEAFLRRYPPVIDHAKANHGMEVWIGECANNVCESPDLPPPARRDYFKAETLKDPGDPEQMAQLEAARAEFYRVCNNADEKQLLDQLTRYCLLSLAWRKNTGFRNYGTNGYDFFPLRKAAHKRWWRENRLNPEVRSKLTAALAAKYQDWEVQLIIYPLTH